MLLKRQGWSYGIHSQLRTCAVREEKKCSLGQRIQKWLLKTTCSCMLVWKLHSIPLGCDMEKISIAHISLYRTFVVSSPQRILRSVLSLAVVVNELTQQVSDSMMDGIEEWFSEHHFLTWWMFHWRFFPRGCLCAKSLFWKEFLHAVST